MNSALECRVRERRSLSSSLGRRDLRGRPDAIAPRQRLKRWPVAKTGWQLDHPDAEGLAGNPRSREDRFLEARSHSHAPAMGAALPGGSGRERWGTRQTRRGSSPWSCPGSARFRGRGPRLALTGRAAREKSQDHIVQIALAHPKAIETLEQRWRTPCASSRIAPQKLALAQRSQIHLERK